MRKILLFIFMICAFSTQAQPAKELLTTFSEKTSEIYDSVKSNVKNGTHFVDTNSTFKEMYHDVRNGIIAMADALKISAEHVYVKLVLQQLVKSIVNLLITLILCFVPLLWFKRMRIWADDTSDGQNGHWGAWFVLTIVPMLFGIIFFFATATTTLTGFINPEYGAMQDIVDMAQQIKSNPTQCRSCR